jgi:hypothetical protein
MWYFYQHFYPISSFIHIDSSEKNLLTLPNGVRLTFGDVIALAGDYYGIPDAPIASPLLNPDQIDSGAPKRFKDAYYTLAVAPYEGKHKVWIILKVIQVSTSSHRFYWT